MKVLILSAPFKFYKGGSELQYSFIDKYLTQEGYDISYLFRYPKKIDSKRKYNTYDYLIRKSYNGYLFTDALKIYNLIRQINPDIIYKRGINYISAVGLFYCINNDIRFIQHIASETDVKRHSRGRSVKNDVKNYYDNLVNGYVIKNAHCIIAQAEYQNILMKKNFTRPADKMVHNFHPIPKYPITKDKKIKVLWIANLKTLKQPEIFISLAKALQNSSAEFIMIGKDPCNEWSDQLKMRIGQIPNLKYIGEQSINDVNCLLKESHIFVNTSSYEGFPNTYIQAFMHKVPIVTLNIDPDNILKKNKIGFHSKKLNQLIEDTDLLIKNAKLRNQMGSQAKSYAIKNHSLQNIKTMIELFGKK